jgi:hypothetical protein
LPQHEQRRHGRDEDRHDEAVERARAALEAQQRSECQDDSEFRELARLDREARQRVPPARAVQLGREERQPGERQNDDAIERPRRAHDVHVVRQQQQEAEAHSTREKQRLPALLRNEQRIFARGRADEHEAAECKAHDAQHLPAIDVLEHVELVLARERPVAHRPPTGCR